MESLLTLHFESLKGGQFLAVLPVSMLTLETSFKVGSFHFHPAGACDIAELRTVPNTPFGPGGFEGQQLREFKTSATGVTLQHFDQESLISFCLDLNWDAFLGATNEDDLRLLRRLSQTAERALNVLKLDYCRLDLSETLPRYVGSWGKPSGFSAALLYTLSDHESYLIAGAAMSSQMVSYGLGLELDATQCAIAEQAVLPSQSDGEVGGIVQHALTLHSEVLAAPTPTIKFVRAMTLLEFLANPDSMDNWAKVKGDIICHVAKTKGEYHNLSERFRQLTSVGDSKKGTQTGYRTLLVHHGRFLDDLLDEKQMRLLFIELDRYIGIVIEEMIARRAMSWDEFTKHRVERKLALGV